MPEIILKSKHKTPKKRFKIARWFLIVAVGVSLTLGVLLNKKETTPQQTQEHTNQETNTKATSVPETITPRKLKIFSGAEFVNFYNSFAYPNVKEFEASPSITGNAAADERIRSLALSRGYVGRSVAIPPLVDVGTYQLQERAASAWQALVSAAKEDGISLSMSAGFRTIEDQRDLFNKALQAKGASVGSIISGKSDAAISEVLKRTSIPGYTRHHSGYAVDIACDNNPAVVFAASTCFTWLSKNNYEKAKTFGWIPSYPEGAPNQGPDPEAWEYCWVGYEAVSEPTT